MAWKKARRVSYHILGEEAVKRREGTGVAPDSIAIGQGTEEDSEVRRGMLSCVEDATEESRSECFTPHTDARRSGVLHEFSESVWGRAGVGTDSLTPDSGTVTTSDTSDANEMFTSSSGVRGTSVKPVSMCSSLSSRHWQA